MRITFVRQAVEIGDRARLVLDGRHTGGRSDDERRQDPARACGLGDGGRDDIGDVVGVALSARGDVATLRRSVTTMGVLE